MFLAEAAVILIVALIVIIHFRLLRGDDRRQIVLLQRPQPVLRQPHLTARRGRSPVFRKDRGRDL